MKKKTILRAVSLGVCAALTAGTMGVFSGCTKKTDTLVIMSEEVNGLFNPFFYTAGPDGEVVSQTQISMLTTDEEGNPACGDDEAVVVKDYNTQHNDNNNTTTYTFVIKNGIKFSDGVPLTMNDVLFNLYVYLDPAYTGSSTMYSTDIVGLQKYRTQRNVSGDSDEDLELTRNATARANDRANELVNLFEDVGYHAGSTNYEASEADMRAAIKTHLPSAGYKKALVVQGDMTDEEARAQLEADYNYYLSEFRKELENDYKGAKDSYSDKPYSDAQGIDFSNNVIAFMYTEGYIDLEYAKIAGTNKDDKSKIIGVKNWKYNQNGITTEEAAINHVYNDKVTNEFNNIVNYWATGTTVKSEYIAKAKEVILHENLGSNKLIFPNIDGIVSLGHQASTKGTEVTGKTGTKYPVASSHNADGTVSGSGYDVLQITINGTDPKAVFNFGFTVAPYHYYSDTSKYEMNIEENKFGVEWGTFDFMKKVIQGGDKNKLPLGAGPYVVTNNKYSEGAIGRDDFWTNNVGYFRANENFLLGAPKIKKMCYQVVSSTNALSVLESGSVHFVTPQLTLDNETKLKNLEKKGIESLDTWQLGYGYIGINAGKIPNINVRKAIMSAMNTSLAVGYYSSGKAVNIAWPMSVVGWAYPRLEGTSYDRKNPLANMETQTKTEHDYLRYPQPANINDANAVRASDEQVKEKIRKYMALAGYGEGDSHLKGIKFTIAGSNLTEHPTYNTFKKAAELLNDCGWGVEVVPDTNALTKLSTGSLTVWAAAWSASVDPDMFQVYHKNSSATSVLSWGYREILADSATYSDENKIITDMSKLIDHARTTDSQEVRAADYKEAMKLVLDLAVEMPCYQRSELFAYNAKVIDKESFPETVNPYTSPLARIWELEFVK